MNGQTACISKTVCDCECDRAHNIAIPEDTVPTKTITDEQKSN